MEGSSVVAKRAWVVAVAVGLAFGAVAVVGRGGEEGSMQGTPAAAAGMAGRGAKAIDFALPDPAGKTVRLSDLKGKVVILSFWATWCPPCRMEMPHLQALHTKYQGKKVRVLGINTDVQGEQLKAWMKENRLSFPVVSDEGGNVATKYRVEGIPTLLVVDQNGKIRERSEGFDPDMEKNLSRLVNGLLKAGSR